MIVSPAPKAVRVFVFFFTLNACIHHFYSFKWAGVTDTPTAGGSKLPSLQATSSNEWNWEGDNLMREREKLSKGGGTRRNGRGFAARTRGRERGGTQRIRLQRDRKTERVGQTVTITTVCLRKQLPWTFGGGGAEQDEGALRTHLLIFLCVFWRFCMSVPLTIKPLWDTWTATHGVWRIKYGHGSSQTWLHVHVSLGRWVLPETGYGNHGGAGLVSGPVGDHPDLPVCQWHGLQQGKTI